MFNGSMAPLGGLKIRVSVVRFRPWLPFRNPRKGSLCAGFAVLGPVAQLAWHGCTCFWLPAATATRSRRQRNQPGSAVGPVGWHAYAPSRVNKAGPLWYVVVIQSDQLDALSTRLTVPLAVRKSTAKVPTALCPAITVQGQRWFRRWMRCRQGFGKAIAARTEQKPPGRCTPVDGGLSMYCFRTTLEA